jgi:hypothetical protein
VIRARRPPRPQLLLDRVPLRRREPPDRREDDLLLGREVSDEVHPQRLRGLRELRGERVVALRRLRERVAEPDHAIEHGTVLRVLLPHRGERAVHLRVRAGQPRHERLLLVARVQRQRLDEVPTDPEGRLAHLGRGRPLRGEPRGERGEAPDPRVTVEQQVHDVALRARRSDPREHGDEI